MLIKPELKVVKPAPPTKVHNKVPINNHLDLTYEMEFVEELKLGRSWKVLLKFDGRQYTVNYCSYGRKQPHIYIILIYLEDAIRNYYANELTTTTRTKTKNRLIEDSYKETRERHISITTNIERLFGKYVLDYFDCMQKIRKTIRQSRK